MTLDVSRLRDTIRDVLASGPPLRLAILFGSRARGAAHPDSDVDVGFIPRDPDLPLAAELELQGRLERACEAAVDLLRVDQGSTLLRWEAARTAIPIVADPPSELSRFLASAALDHAESRLAEKLARIFLPRLAAEELGVAGIYYPHGDRHHRTGAPRVLRRRARRDHRCLPVRQCRAGNGERP